MYANRSLFEIYLEYWERILNHTDHNKLKMFWQKIIQTVNAHHKPNNRFYVDMAENSPGQIT